MKTVNQLIKELQSLRDDLRELPAVVQAPNGMFFEADAKQLFDENESPMLGHKPKRMIITWE
jgi:hypothetical protein